MFSQFQTSYRRMEESLQRLTDSIAAYNPSPAAADDLVAADDAVNEDLERRTLLRDFHAMRRANRVTVSIHQANHARILALRRTTEALDQNIKDTVKLLADTRKDVISIPADDSAHKPRRAVDVDELLQYAKFISKTTVPPTFRKPVPEVKLPKISDEQAQAQITNGMATPPPGAQDSESTPYARSEIVGMQAMPQHSQDWLESFNNLPFEPWPSHGIIQQGALADIQRMIEDGRDPTSLLSPEEQAEADRRKAEEEERERLEQEERSRRRMSVSAAQGSRNRPDVFNPDDM